MCQFFSFLTDGDRRIYYFSGERRRKGLRFRDGQKIDNYDSHTSIARYYGLREDAWSRAEYNPFTDALTLDRQQTTWNEDNVRRVLSWVDWDALCGDLEGARAFLQELREIRWLQPDGKLEEDEHVKLFATRVSAWAAARDVAWDAARDAARKTVLNAARNAAGDAERNAAGDAAREPALDAARDAAWNAAGNAVLNAAWKATRKATRKAARGAAWAAAWDAALCMDTCCICKGLPLSQRHVDHVARRMDVWRHGYGVQCDVDGVLYCYERL